jgi:hypothetical protein
MRHVAASVLLAIALLMDTGPSWGQYQDLAARIDTAVVFITVNRPGIGAGCASGFFIDPNGYILTARHVISGADTIIARTADGTQYPASIVGYGSSESEDVALLKVAGSGFSALNVLPLPTVEQGQEILVFGYPRCTVPQMAGTVTVTRGIVSAIRTQEGLIQIDAAANPGNSGGPVVTSTGNVIGIEVAGMPNSQGLNFALDLHHVLSLITPPYPTSSLSAPPALSTDFRLSGTWSGLFQVTGVRNSNTGKPCCPVPQLPQYQETVSLTQSADGVTGAMYGGILAPKLSGSFDSNAGTFSLSSSNSALTLAGVLQRDGTIAGTFDGIPNRWHFAGTGLFAIVGAIGIPVTLSGQWVARKQ